ncbi:SDR family oxidoreductase (plasmid) [Deinococcus metallilatus]|uniref:2-keto-3-deoxy-L-fuconate dehydrogenase n=1 Tax=Deinococcus metallilatus TaxID=1211322 RepID=A0AAJ5JZX9_9DEIO|nr:SDR family oxidoreductase [Deinococcus metallilatus]MBB5293506.1 2-keto-3-deoxy-L-fuconate dehydrogenase [Deinococcus metallilatus]QBY06585.1 SDR family oxidoreductase [Deinococcus metallilatus]RXJ17928.1 SDR family oxidoreductase [Deinococcus metallilatus]TLK32199.1 SDR family oxidoreductase [Deinococcus metallilatus]GMA15274.1 short-chain dehydrogenase/reductase [Deinococcus metallilatus]
MNRLAGKNVLVTAAGQGIGRAIAERLIAEGGNVTATDLRPELLEGLDARTRALDVTRRDQIQALVDELGTVDVLVNSAGFVHNGTILDTTDADWDFSFNLNARSMFWTMQAVLPGMLATGGGCIINVASVASSILGVPNRFVYGASKAAVIGMTRSVAADYVTRGVRVNAICPGTVESPSLRERIRAQAAASGEDEETVYAAFVARQPLGRIGKPGEVAALAAYLASDEASFTTGQIHVIDGGWSNA